MIIEINVASLNLLEEKISTLVRDFLVENKLDLTKNIKLNINSNYLDASSLCGKVEFFSGVNIEILLNG
jgi:hypothetical protein